MTQPNPTGGEFVYQAIVDAGIDLLIGLPGTQTLPIDRAVHHGDDLRYVMARNETVIPHIAWGHYETGGGVAATLTVPGPGETNAMHGFKNALEDGVPLLHLSADVNPDERGQAPIHEIESDTYDPVLLDNFTVERPEALPGALAKATALLERQPSGPVRVGIPKSILETRHSFSTAAHTPSETSHDTTRQIEEVVSLLESASRPAILVGGGARHSSMTRELIEQFAELLDAPVAVTYKGKGSVPEDHDRFLGVTGGHFPTASRDILDRADVVMALGTDLDGVTTDHWSIPLGDALIQVTLDEADINAGYDVDIAILDELRSVIETLIDTIQDRTLPSTWDGAMLATAARETYEQHLTAEGLDGDQSPLQTPAVLSTVRSETPRDAIVTVDVGGFRLWAMQAFPVYRADRFVAAGSWAGMGVGLPAAIGAKLANPDQPVLSLTGDGGLLMCLHELHTAVEEGLDITIVCSNNSDYGVISKSPAIATETGGTHFAWSAPDFATIADGFGAHGISVDTLSGLRSATRASFNRTDTQPTLINVEIDPTEPTAAAAASASPPVSEALLEKAMPDPAGP